MQKKIGYVDLDSSMSLWLKEHLPEGELKESLTKLTEGEYSALMLEMDAGNTVSGSPVLSIGGLVINERSRSVEVEGKDVSLTPKEFDILLFLARNRGEVFTKEQIYKAVWEDDYLMDDSNIMAFIRKLRKKIEPNPDAPKYILTIWGIGYKFNERL